MKNFFMDKGVFIFLNGISLKRFALHHRNIFVG